MLPNLLLSLICSYSETLPRLRVVPHFSSGIVERAKCERAWKSPYARKGDIRWGERKMRDPHSSLSPPHVAFSLVGWFSRMLAFRLLYYPWGKMGDYSLSKPCHNKDPVITKNTWKPGRITVKYVETNPAIANRFWQSQHTIYPTVTNILSSCSQQSVKMTDSFL